MLDATVRNVLNRLLVIHSRSLPQYLMYARPYAPGAGHEKLEVLQQIVDDQTQMSERIVSLLVEADAPQYSGNFPMEFTDLHDLSIDYLIQEAVAHQRRDIRTIEACVEALKSAPTAHALAEEALGMAKGHLQSLEELVAGAGNPLPASHVA